MTISTEAAKVAGQNQVTDADLLRICQSFNPGQDFDLAKAVRAEVLSKLRAPVADERHAVDPCGYVAVKRSAVDWLKDKFPALTIKAGLCERISGRLYTITRLMRDHDAALASAPVAGEALGWRVRERRGRDGKLLDCFVEAPAVPGMAYAQEVLGDDYAEAQGGIEGKLKHCQMIVAWANAVPQASAEAVRNATLEKVAGIVGGQRWGGADGHVSALIAEHIRALKRPSMAGDGLQRAEDVAVLVAFIFERFGRPGDAGELPDSVAAAVRRLEATVQPQASENDDNLVGHFGTTVTGVMVTSLASLAYRYAMTLSFATRHADCDQLEGIARRVTAKLKDEIRAIISGQSGSSS